MEETQQLYCCKAGASPKVLPIDPATDDPFYRYKMHQLAVQFIGKGKMIRTQFINVEEVAKDLKVPAAYLPTYFGQSIGAQAAYDKKKPERERASISGEYQLDELSELLTRFIRQFVLCGRCALPEYSFVPLKKRIGVKCRSCGFKTYVDKMDLPAKFIRFVQNKPPPKTAHLDKNVAKGAEAVKKREKEDAKLLKQAAKLKVDVEEEEVEWETDLSEAAQAARAAEMVPDKLKGLVDMKAAKEAAAAAAAAKDSAAAPAVDAKNASSDDNNNNNNVDDDDNDDDQLVASLRSKLDDSKSTLSELSQISDSSRAAELLFLACCESLSNVNADVKKHAKLLIAFVGGKEASAHALLSAWSKRLEAVSEEDLTPLKKRVPVQCKTFYDLDIVEEDPFLSWAALDANKSSRLVKIATPFLAWLQQADEESSEEE